MSLPKIKQHPKNAPAKPPVQLRTAQPVAVEPAPEALRLLPEEMWALERSMLLAEKADAEKAYALARRALLLVQLDIGGKITAAEKEAAAAEKFIAEQRKAYEAKIESIRSRLGITGEFDFDSTSGVITVGGSPAQRKE
jgi:hypothetical protein